MMNNKYLVSIIIPIYKVEKYLRDCLNSVINQTYTNIEIILVNDGSPDLSGKICEEYASNDPRIKYYEKSNGGLSDARNFGLSKALGDYVIFLDSDDIISRKQIEILLQNAIKYDALVSCGSMYKFKDGQSFNEPKIKNKVKIFKGQEFAELMIRPMGVFCFACGRLMHKDVYSHLTFPVGKLFEDVFSMPQLFFNVSEIVFTTAQLYYYRYRNTSLSHSSFNPKSMDEMDAYLYVLKLGEEKKDKKIVFYAALFFVTKYHYYYLRVIKHKMDLFSYKKKYKEAAKYCWLKVLSLGR